MNIILREKLLDNCVNEYADIKEIFINMDSKAQNMVTISGIFIAASLAFFSIKDFQNVVSTSGTLLISIYILAIIYLVVSVFFCVLAMLIRYVPASSDYDMAIDLITMNNEINNERYQNLLNDLIKDMIQSIKNIAIQNKYKAEYVLFGQLCLTAAIMCFALFIVVFALALV